MKEEKEMSFIFKLQNSNYVKRILKTPQKLCVKDFERFVGASENNKEFLNWIKEFLIFDSLGTIEGRNKRIVKLYTLDGKKLDKRLRELNCYSSAKKYFDDRYFTKLN